MKKPKQERRETPMNVRVRESVKGAAERLAKEDGRSLANWLERMIEAEAARHDGKRRLGACKALLSKRDNETARPGTRK